MDVAWAVKGAIYRTREMGVGLRELMKYSRRVGVLEERCPSVKLWGEGWGLKQGWHEGEKKAIRREVLVERCERGWVEQEQVVTIVRCVDYGVSGTRPWGRPTWRYFDKNDL